MSRLLHRSSETASHSALDLIVEHPSVSKSKPRVPGNLAIRRHVTVASQRREGSSPTLARFSHLMINRSYESATPPGVMEIRTWQRS